MKNAGKEGAPIYPEAAADDDACAARGVGYCGGDLIYPNRRASGDYLDNAINRERRNIHGQS